MLSGEEILSLRSVTVVKSRVLRTVLMILGWLWVGIAFVGVFVPLVPTVGPILLAGFLFSRSSERFDAWLVNNRYFGQTVVDWRDGAGFSAKAKVIAVAAIAASFTISIVVVTENIVVRMGLAALGLAIALYVVSRPTKQIHVTPATSSQT